MQLHAIPLSHTLGTHKLRCPSLQATATCHYRSGTPTSAPPAHVTHPRLLPQRARLPARRPCPYRGCRHRSPHVWISQFLRVLGQRLRGCTRLRNQQST